MIAQRSAVPSIGLTSRFFEQAVHKVLAGYELQDGKCVKIWDPVPVRAGGQNYVPEPGQPCPSQDSGICNHHRHIEQANRISAAEAGQALTKRW